MFFSFSEIICFKDYLGFMYMNVLSACICVYHMLVGCMCVPHKCLVVYMCIPHACLVVYMCVPHACLVVYMCTTYMSSATGDQKGALDPPGLKLQVVVYPSDVWVLGT